MVYKKRVVRRYKKKATRGKIYGRALSQVAKDVSMLKNLINTEFKFYDTSIDSTVSATPAVTDIGSPSVGDGAQNVDGMQYRLKSINADINVTLPSNVANQLQTIVRMWWVLDIDAFGTIPAFTDIFTNPIGSTPTVCLRNLSNKNRFLILKDKTVILNPSGSQAAHIKYYRKMDAKVAYNTATSNINHNRVLFVYVSNQVGVNAPTFRVFNRLRFIDN